MLRGASFEISGIRRRRNVSQMEYVTSFPTRYGRRLVVNGFEPTVISGFMGGYLSQIPHSRHTDSYLLERGGLPLASAIRGKVAQRPTVAPALHAALTKGEREFTPAGGKPQVLASAPVRDTTWRVVTVTDRDRLYASVGGSARILPWTIFGVLAAAVLAVIWLLVRFVRNAGALARANLSLAESNTQLAHDALHDTLTSLPNRNLFRDRLEHALQRARRAPDRVCAVGFLDVDHFKLINDSLGHQTGDHVLVALAQRLQTLVRPGDTVARLGGDEFTILLEDVEGAVAASAAIDRLTAGLADPLTVDGHEYFVTMSAGIAVGSAGAHPDDLLRDADTAMYRAKANGRACHVLFDPRMREQVVHRADLQNGLRQALRRGDIKVAYQPIFDLATGELAAFEALARWQTREGRSVSPADFIPVAEESGLIGELGRRVLATACESLVEWRSRGVVGPDASSPPTCPAGSSSPRA